MLDFNVRTRYYLCDKPTDMRKGRNGLAGIVREILNRDPLRYDEAFIFYGWHYDIVKILHYDLNGYVMYEKWFDEGRRDQESLYCQQLLEYRRQAYESGECFLSSRAVQ
mgnify:CR=1 FL=1